MIDGQDGKGKVRSGDGTRLENNLRARRDLVMEQESMRLIQAKRASEVLSVSLARLYELARLGVIPVVRLGPRQIRFDEDALTQWVRQGGAVQDDGAVQASRMTRSGVSP